MESFESKVRNTNSSVLPLHGLKTPTMVSRFKTDITSGRIKRKLHKDLKRFRIPEEDLIILERIYHKQYPECGRKRGALLRYIKFFKETQEPPPLAKDFLKFIQKKANGLLL